MMRAPATKLHFLGDYAADLHGYRQLFIDMLRRHVPQLQDSLASEVLPLYQAGNRDTKRIRAELERWAKQWHLAGVDWFTDSCLDTLRIWDDHPQAMKHRVFEAYQKGELAATTDGERAFKLEHAGWTPNFEKWSDFEKKVRAEFKQRLKSYRRSMDEIASGRGFHNVSDPKSADHFLWLALFQCAGKTEREIAEIAGVGRTKGSSADIDVSAISKGIKSAADVLGIARRKNRAPNLKSEHTV